MLVCFDVCVMKYLQDVVISDKKMYVVFLKQLFTRNGLKFS